MGVQRILWMFSSLFGLFYFVLGQDEINVAAIVHSEEDGKEINWNALTENVRLGVNTKDIAIVANDCWNSARTLCDNVAKGNGVTAILNSDDNNTISNTMESFTDFLGIPFINTVWTSRDSKEFQTTFSVFPEASLLSQAYGTIVESLSLPTFAVVYEDEESLLKLQDVLKLQVHQVKLKRNSLIIKKLNPNGDSRHIFKEIRKTPIYSLVIDCRADKIIDVLLQAKDVKLLDDVSSNILLTSLDAHTLDYSVLDIKTNITTIRLFNSAAEHVQQHLIKSFPTDIDAGKVTVKMALMHDAMLLLAESLNAVKSTHADGEIVYEPLFCNASEKYSNKYGLVSALQKIAVKGITGDISLDKSRKRENFRLDIIEIYRKDKPIGYWSSDDPNKVELTRNATEREAEYQQRLQNHNFIVTSRIGGPYLFESNDSSATGNNRYYGYSMDLIAEIAKFLNITFEFRITKDNLYPNLQKDLTDRRADLAICDFTITPQRRAVIDFSMPFMTLGIGILHKQERQEEDANLYGFLGPFSTVVWFYIGLLYLFMSLILVLIARISTGDWENPHPCDQNPAELENIWNLKNCCWLTLGSITTQGCDILPKGGCTRIATASWWIFSLIIASSYTANLAAFLTMSKQDDSIKNVEELAGQSKVKFGCLGNGATASFFQFSSNPLYQRMWNTMLNEKPLVFEDSNAKGVERVLSTKNNLYAFFMESTGIEYEMERKCDLIKIGDLLDSKSYGIGMHMNAEYRHSINTAILRLQETGKLLELKNKWWKEHREGEPCPSSAPENTDALALENVGGIFIVLAAGIGLAFFIAILEFLWNVHNISVEEHISYMEALKIELKFACNIFITRKRAKPIISESSSSKSDDGDDEEKSNKAILIGAGSFLNINATILNRFASATNINDEEKEDSRYN